MNGIRKFTVFIGLVLTASISASGCSHLIAKQIASKQHHIIEGELPNFVKSKTFCTETMECIDIQALDYTANLPIKLKFSFTINQTEKLWKFDSSTISTKKNSVHMIVVFPGYGQPKEILFIHQLWLSKITGAEVIVVGSASDSRTFMFGLDQVAPILKEIQRTKPTRVDLIGFSMGAIAAQRVSEQVPNAKLHLVAPMTSFEASTIAVWQELYSDSLFANFVMKDHLVDAVGLVFKESGLHPEEIEIVNAIKKSEVKTYIYTSQSDKITIQDDWMGFQSELFSSYSYLKLNHLEIVSLLNERLLREFLSNLMENELVENTINTTGVLCEISE